MLRAFCLIGLLSTLICLAPNPASAQNLLNNPESVVYDSVRDRYLVSNWGDGAIIQIDSGGTQTYFSTALMNQFRVAGLYIFGDTLLAAAGDAPGAGIVGFDLATAMPIFDIPIPGIGLPNDITSDSDGLVYVTDYWGSKLFKIRDHIPTPFVIQGLPYPNGMLYDQQHGRLLILSVTGPGAPIMAVSIADSSVSTVVATGLNGIDGIVMDGAHQVYVSEWSGDTVQRFDSAFSGPPELFSSGHHDPADIYYDGFNGVLAVPNFGSNTVDFIELMPATVQPAGAGTTPRTVLFQNQPNPFNPATTINYQLAQVAEVVLTIHGTTGNLIRTLVDERQPAGLQTVAWDGADNRGHQVGSGVYFYRLQTAGEEAPGLTRKMLLLR